MRLGQKQELFSRLVPRLLDKAFEMGFEVRLGDAYRDPRVHGIMGEKKSYSAANSCHKLKLAIDLNLFKDGVFLQSTEDHRPLGEWWEQQHELMHIMHGLYHTVRYQQRLIQGDPRPYCP